ncbi:MAG: CoA transferase, partial [Hoeflea sp.]
MAAISGLEYLDRPSRQDLARFSKLFLPMFEAASPQTRRTAAAALSRLPRVPDDVAEILINQPIDVAAPFIAHYPGLKENALTRAVTRNGAPHARAAARRSDLSPQAISALRALGDPSVEGLLVLRGLIPDPAKQTSRKFESRIERVANAERRTVETPPLDPSEQLREQLRALALRAPSPAPAAPLAGLKVLDLAWVVAGPMIGRNLADFGATVVRMETAKRVDTARNMGPFPGGTFEPARSALFDNCNTGKLGLSLDLGRPEARAVVRDLAAWADVVVESFAPGQMDRWEIG